jgi:hypothetical protein
MFCRPCFNRFWGLKYIPRLFSEYMLTLRHDVIRELIAGYIDKLKTINKHLILIELPYKCKCYNK